MNKLFLFALAALMLACVAHAHLVPRKLPVWKIPEPILAAPELYREAAEGLFNGRGTQDQIFTMTFVTSTSSAKIEAMKDAVRFAARLLSHKMDVPDLTDRDLRVEVTIETLSGGALGGAAPRRNCLNNDTGIYEPAALPRLRGAINNCSSDYEIRVQLSDTANFYTGTDGKGDADEYDLVSVMLHEFVHALGFQTLINCSESTTTCNYGKDRVNLFDNYLLEGSTPFDPTTKSSSELRAFATGGNAFQANPAILEQGQSAAALYTPSTFSKGSSIAHLAESYDGTSNALMTFSLAPGQVVHDIGGITNQLLKGFGYPMNDCLSFSNCSTCTMNYCQWCFYDNTCGDGRLSPYEGSCSTNPGFLSDGAYCDDPDGSTVASATTTSAATITSSTSTTGLFDCGPLSFICPANTLDAALLHLF